MRISEWRSDVCSSDLGSESIVARVVVVGALRRPHDRRVASAAAEVAGQGVIDHALAGKIFVVAGHGEERHDEARRAEAALRAVAVDHRLLQIGRAHSELQSLMRISYAVFCLKKKKRKKTDIKQPT